MTAGLFQQLSLTSKSSFLWTDGEYLMSRREGDYQVKLFSIFNFFVEVYYNDYQKQIEKIKVDVKYQHLSSFTDSLEVSDFY